MADTGTDFLVFLKVYYPDDYIRLSSDKVSDEMVTAVVNKHQARFDIWKRVPERIRDEYFGRVPDDILEAAKTDNHLSIEEVRKIEDERNKEAELSIEAPLAASLVAFGVADIVKFSAEEKKAIMEKSEFLLDRGHGKEKADKMAVGLAIRNNLRGKRERGEISDDVYKEKCSTINKELQNGCKEWTIEHKPETALIMLFKDMDSGKIGMEEGFHQAAELIKRVVEKGKIDRFLEMKEYKQNKMNNPEMEVLINSLIGRDKDDMARVRGKVRKDQKPIRTMTIPEAPKTMSTGKSKVVVKNNDVVRG